jgi:hypothetical protein
MITKPGTGKSGWLRTGSVILIVTSLLAYDAAYILKQFNHVDPTSYISGNISRDAYIARYRPEYHVYQYANKHLPDNVKILGLFLGNRRYYSDRELIFAVEEFKQIVKSADSGWTLLNILKNRGYTHLMVRYDLFNSWMNKQFDDGKKQLLQKLFSEHVKHLLSGDGYGLFELN